METPIEQNLVLATKNDINKIYSLYSDVIEDLNGRKIFQWDNRYPNLEFIESRIENNEMFILRAVDKEIVAAVVLNRDQSKEWPFINWSSEKSNQLVIHALVVSPKFQGQGLGRKMVEAIEEYAVSFGHSGIRLDAFSENVGANSLYKKLGYSFRGEITVDTKPVNHQIYYCYDKTFTS